jgi:hypothetical protein
MRLVLAFLFMVAAAGPGLGQTLAEGSLTLGGKVVPLPPGPWRVVYQAAEPGRSTEGNLATTTHRAVLVQERAGQAAAVVVAHAAAEMGGRWNPHGICVNTAASVLHRRIEMAVPGSLDCTGLVLVTSGRTQAMPAWLNAIYDEGERRPGWIPPRWISAQIIQSQQIQWLSVEYRFAPGVFAPPTATATNWAEGVRSPAQQEVVRQLRAWSDRARAELQRGLYGRAPSAPLPAPF